MYTIRYYNHACPGRCQVNILLHVLLRHTYLFTFAIEQKPGIL